MFGMGHYEIIILLIVVLLVFGAKRIPEMAQGLGKGIKEFRKAMRDVKDEVDMSEPSTAGTIGPSPAPDQVSRQTPPAPQPASQPGSPASASAVSGTPKEASDTGNRETSQG